MKGNNFTAVFLLTLLLHVLLCNFLNLSFFVTISLLPLLIFCLPVSCGTSKSLLIAFVCGLAADFLSDGMLGMSSAALLFVALARKPLLKLFFGNEIFSRNEDLSFNRQSPLKILAALILFVAIFMAVYVYLDSAGTRPFWVNALCFGASIAASVTISFIQAGVLLNSQERRWR